MLSRRQFLLSSVAVAASGAGVGLYTWKVEPHWLEIVQRTLPIRNLPKDLIGKRLVHISDVHVGRQVADEYLLDTFRRVRTLRPDIVAYSGDFTSYHSGVLQHVERIYAEMPRGSLATVGVLGNHDYGPDWSHPDHANRMAAVLAGQGLQILRNQVIEVTGLQIAGLDDLWAGRFRPVQAFAAIDPLRPGLALSHNPDTADLPGWERFQGWILAGHTHGGQCKPPFLPPPLLSVKNRRYTSGEFSLSDGRSMYISRGVGHLLGSF